ncbi:MAG: hypothetical protein LBS00_10550 [Synergistaceae bacterium]|nr:hypothetical protein [Synergistaceae bacterium]
MDIKREIYKKIDEDAGLIDAISQSTNSVKKVKYRFECVETLLAELLR